MEQNPFSLSNKTVLVTGASSGIGRAISIRCSEMGANIILTARNQSRLQETLYQMSGKNHIELAADLTEKVSIGNLVEQLPDLDGIVHCAGVNHRIVTKLIEPADIEQTISPNLVAPILLQTALLKAKKIKKEASIIFIASRAAYAPSVGNALYSASKGAMISYAKVLALELAPRQIRVNCICPAMVLTNMISNIGFNHDELNEAQQKYPLKRYGTPDDIAYLSIYLLSSKSSWMTGSCIDITGGGEGVL